MVPSPHRPLGRVSAFIGSRLLIVGVVASVVGFVCLVLAGVELWLVVSRGRLGRNVVPLVAGGGLAFALLSIGQSAWRTGLRYVRGEKAVSRDLAQFVARRLRQRRGEGRP